MAESTLAPGPVTDEDAAAAARLAEARRRKERREAKIKAGGSSRLNKISGIGGGLQREPPPPPPTKPEGEHGDPAEVDISEHFYQPKTTERPPVTAATFGPERPPVGPDAAATAAADAQLRELLAQGPGDFAAGMDGLPENDPMAAMLAQMMQSMGGGMPGVGGPGGPGGPGGGPGNDVPLAGGGFPGFPGFPGAQAQQQQQRPAAPSASAALWRLVHFAVAVALGLYVAIATPFAGTQAEREREKALEAGDYDYDTVHRRYFFYMFATAETVLLTSRFFLQRGLGGKGSGSAAGGLLTMALGFAPPAVRRSVEVGWRYWQIFSTIRMDLLVCVFVLGVCSWTRSGTV